MRTPSFRQHHERIEIERDQPLAERMGHPPKADKRFLQRGYVGGLFAAEPLKEFGGLETVDHRFRPCGGERGQLQRNIAQQLDENAAEPTRP